MKRITIVSGAWHPQVNGVVRTLDNTIARLKSLEPDTVITMLTPYHNGLKNYPLPTYPEIRVAFVGKKQMAKLLIDTEPDFVHVAVEDPFGLQAVRACIDMGWQYTSAYHTMFPEYLRAHLGIPTALGYKYAQWVHGHAAKTFVASEALSEYIKPRLQITPHIWTRGVDTELFNPSKRDESFSDTDGYPYLLYVGRVSAEKSIERFLEIKSSFKKVVVGGGPALNKLRSKYPDAIFLGPLHGEELARVYASALAFVFPSKTDTFGLVMIEAMASGLHVAAYRHVGPQSIIVPGTGSMNDDLKESIICVVRESLASKFVNQRITPRDHVLRKFTWDIATKQFSAGLVPIF